MVSASVEGRSLKRERNLPALFRSQNPLQFLSLTGSHQRIGGRPLSAIFIAGENKQIRTIDLHSNAVTPFLGVARHISQDVETRGHERNFFESAQFTQTPYPPRRGRGLQVPPQIIANHSSPGSRLETLNLLLNTILKEAKILA